MEDRSCRRSPAEEVLPRDEARLLEQIRSGDVEAGQQFVREHYAAIYRYLLHFAGQPDLAEDLTQETFLQGWRYLDTFQGRGSLRAWLLRIARRKFLHLLQRRQAEAGSEGLEELSAPDATSWMDAVELRQVIERLPLEEREVLLLHYLEGYTSSEIAPVVGVPARTVRRRLEQARERLRQELGEDDLSYLNEPLAPMRQWAWLPLDQMYALETRLAFGGEAKEDEMERREFLRQTTAAAVGLVLSEPAKEVVDGRLTHKVSLAFKGTALSELCDYLRQETGIHLSAGASIADEKVTLLCKQMPLREVMRQLSRPFGYTWSRSGTAGEYRYELMQDLRSQLLEEELRNRDRHAGLIALEQEIDRFRPYLGLSPDEALARSRTAPEAERPLLRQLAEYGWGPIQIYFRLPPQELAALRAGETLRYSTEPRPGEKLLPPELRSGVLQSQRAWRMMREENGGYGVTQDANNLAARPLTSFPEVGARVALMLGQIELGRFALRGITGHFAPRDPKSGLGHAMGFEDTYAIGPSPAVRLPERNSVGVGRPSDPPLRVAVTFRPRSSCQLRVPQAGTSGQSAVEPRVTTADVLEALFQATGRPIVADYYTRLYKPEAVSVRNQPLFEALNRLGEAMRVRWQSEGDWLQFRSASYYDDRLKEVPNRLMVRWASARRQQGMLRLDDLVEIAQLTDDRLNGSEMAEGAQAIWGLEEWRLVRSETLRPHLRFLAQFTPEQRQKAMSAAGLPFVEMSLPQQQGFLARALNCHPDDDKPLRSLDELAGAALRVEYTQPGWFQWTRPHMIGKPRWVRELEPESQGRRVLMPPVRERTREAALQAVRRILPTVEASEIYPTELDLAIVYFPGTSNARLIHFVNPNSDLTPG